MAVGGVNVPIGSTWNPTGVNKAKADLGTFERQFADFGSSIKKSFIGLGAGVAAGFGLSALKDQIGQAIGAASDLAESQSKVGVVFGDSAYSIESWSKTAATALLMTQQQALETTGTFGNLFQAFGIGQQQAAEWSKRLVELGADLSSFNNLDPGVVLDKLRSGITGEQEAVKDLGIALTDQRLRQEAFNQGIYDGTGVLTANQKVQAAYALILQDTALAQGDVERTASGFANTMRALEAAVGNAQASIGEGFVLAIQNASKSLGGPDGLVTWIETTGRSIGDFVVGIADALGRIQEFTEDIGGAGTSILDLYKQIPGLGLFITMSQGLAGAGQEVREETEQASLAQEAFAQDLKDTALQHRIVGEAARGAAYDFKNEKDEVSSLNQQIALLNAGLDHMAARASVEAAIDAFSDADTQGSKTWKDKHGKTHTTKFSTPFITDWNAEKDTFDVSTAAGRKGLDLASALILATQKEASGEYDPATGKGSRKAALATYRYGRKQLIEQLTGIGVPRSEAQAFARQNLKTPGAVRQVTTVTNNVTNNFYGSTPQATKQAASAFVRLVANSTRPGSSIGRGAVPASDSTRPTDPRNSSTATDRGLNPAS